MNLNQYQQEVARTCATSGNHGETLKMAGFGLSGEVGEVIDTLKKYMWHNHLLDMEHLKKELGDVMWYLATLANEFGISLDDVIAGNVEKLRKRYPDGFSSERSINREEQTHG